MKNMKPLLMLVFITALLCFTACKKVRDSGIEGKWKVIQATGSAADMNIGMIYSFDSSGRLSISKDSLKTEWIWKNLESGKLEVQMEGMPPWKVKYKIKGDTMTYETEKSGQVFTLKKDKIVNKAK